MHLYNKDIKDFLLRKIYDTICRNYDESSRTLNKPNGQFITMKPRAATIAARFNDSLHNLLGNYFKTIVNRFWLQVKKY